MERILAFLREIGLEVHLGPVPRSTFLTGIQLVANGLRVDTELLEYPGDLLHEAGHLAVMTPADRAVEFPSSSEPGEEMAALAWSYAAALHLRIPPEFVFHEHGYRGQASQLVAGYCAGNGPGIPMLWWLNLCTAPTAATPSSFPKMTQWLRTSVPQEFSDSEEPVLLDLCNST